MKKKTLYKLVKESLKEVLQEQESRNIDNLQQNPLSPNVDPDTLLPNDPFTTGNVEDPTNSSALVGDWNGDFYEGCAMGGTLGATIDFGSIELWHNDCNAYAGTGNTTTTADDGFICCSTNNPYIGGIGTQGSDNYVVEIGGQNILGLGFNNTPCYCPNPQSMTDANNNLYLTSCDVAGGQNSNFDITDLEAWALTTSNTNLSLDGITGIANDGSKCAGCNNPAGLNFQETDYGINFPAQLINPNLIGCPSTAGDYTTLTDENDIRCCEFEGCIDTTAAYSNADGSTPGSGPGATNLTNTITTADGTVYTAGDPNGGSWSDNGSCEFPGCSDPIAINFTTITSTITPYSTNSPFNSYPDDQSCILGGCMNPDFANSTPTYQGNYDPTANFDDQSCQLDGFCNLIEDGNGTLHSNYICNITPGLCITDPTTTLLVLDVSQNPLITPNLWPTYPGAAAQNYNLSATVEDGTCNYDSDGDGVLDVNEVDGCTNLLFDTYLNEYTGTYDPLATEDDGTCEINNFCNLPNDGNLTGGAVYSNYICILTPGLCITDPTTTLLVLDVGILGSFNEDNINCSAAPVPGCTDDGSDPNGNSPVPGTPACNYTLGATQDDGTCEYTSCSGCIDVNACNYDSNATIDDGSCDFTTCAGCTINNMDNYDSNATINDGTCEHTGCLDQFDSNGVTINANYVCENSMPWNLCTVDGTQTGGWYQGGIPHPIPNPNLGLFIPGTCTQTQISGCMDIFANNHNPLANTDDGSCTYDCMFIEATACNFGDPITRKCITIDNNQPQVGQSFRIEVEGIDDAPSQIGLKEVDIQKPQTRYATYNVTRVEIPQDNKIINYDQKTCYPTTWDCKCLSTPCGTSEGHKHKCKPRFDGQGSINSLQTCLSWCPCEVTNPAVVGYKNAQVYKDSCSSHSDSSSKFPFSCMNDKYQNDSSSEDKNLPDNIKKQDIPDIVIPDITVLDPEAVKESKKLRKSLKELFMVSKKKKLRKIIKKIIKNG